MARRVLATSSGAGRTEDTRRARPPDEIGAMFNRIARRYDALNRLLSLRRDQRWRRTAARLLIAGKARTVLDLATGTADLPVTIVQMDQTVQATGIDIAATMLEVGRRKLERLGLSGRISLLAGDAQAIPAADRSFDAVTIAFGIRNVSNYRAALDEMLRVLRPGGRALVLEFSLPGSRLFRLLYLMYFRHVLPAIGGLLTGNRAAYKYLNRSVEFFPSGDAFNTVLAETGFAQVRRLPLTFGIATIYRATRPAQGAG